MYVWVSTPGAAEMSREETEWVKWRKKKPINQSYKITRTEIVINEMFGSFRLKTYRYHNIKPMQRNTEQKLFYVSEQRYLRILCDLNRKRFMAIMYKKRKPFTYKQLLSNNIPYKPYNNRINNIHVYCTFVHRNTRLKWTYTYELLHRK